MGDLDGAMAELKDRGVEFVTGALEVPGSGGERFAFFPDNNGILIELYEPTPENEAGAREEGEGREEGEPGR